MIFKSKKKIGFTLIELIIYISILSGITIVVADSFLILNKGRAGVEAKSELNSSLRFLTEKIKRDITSSNNLIIPAEGIMSSTTSLKLGVASSSIEYTLDGTRIKRQVTQFDSSQSFEYITPDTVKINSLYFFRLENVNSVLSKRKISVEMNVQGSYNSTSPEWQYSQNERISADLNVDLDVN